MEKYLQTYPPILSVNDVAYILGITAKTVRYLIKTGDISSIKVGRLIKIPKNKLIDYLDQQN